MAGDELLPPLDELGRDLLVTRRGRLIFALVAPFACAGLYFAFAAAGWWPAALAAVALLSFFTYGSTSHELVHRNFGLPRAVNELLLAATEALVLRSGHAYRISHIHHHQLFPDKDDAEGRPAHLPLWKVLLEAPLYIPGLWLWSWRRASAERPWIALETAWCAGYLVVAVALWPRSPALLVYAGLVIAATWVFPVGLVYLQHDPSGPNALFQTRAYRGRIIPALLMQHLFHLEHHLYPTVPAHHWRELSRRLDPFLRRAGVRVISIP